MLSANQRSYSRMSSKGMIGDESPLMSPLPLYPRRRSVTFAEEGIREERPCYNPAYPESAPVSPVRRASPPPPSILKKTYTVEDDVSRPAAETSAPVPAATLRGTIRSTRNSPIPQRSRSASRQRLAARRQEAQLHRSFYDDSFVEEFVLNAKSEFEKEEQQRQELEKEMRVEKEKARRAEQRVADTNDKISALQRAKEVLLAAAQRGRPSTTPSPTRHTQEGPRSSRRHSHKTVDEADLLQNLEEDSDPEVQAALTELAKASSRESRKRQHKRRSMPIVSETVLIDSEEEDRDAVEAHRKRAKLERIVEGILAQQKRGKSKKSVVVINWSDEEDSASQTDGDYTPPPSTVAQKRRRGGKSSSVAIDAEAPFVATARRAASHRQSTRRAKNTSVAPELSDSLLMESEDQPILLPRRRAPRPATTRSISHLGAEVDDLLLNEEMAVTCKPPRTNTRAPRGKRAPPVAPRPPRTVFTSSRADPYAAMRTPVVAPPTAPVKSRRVSRPAAPAISPDDPMAVFFDAAFPSPSKFDNMMLQAGGLPDARRGGRGQPNLVLPTSIGRRR